jgi:hypothetical protein
MLFTILNFHSSVVILSSIWLNFALMTENQKPNDQELLAMISLLDDEDETIYESLLSHFWK